MSINFHPFAHPIHSLFLPTFLIIFLNPVRIFRQHIQKKYWGRRVFARQIHRDTNFSDFHHYYRGDNSVLWHRGTTSLCSPGCAPTRWHISETGTPVLHSSTLAWPASPATESAAKLHYEERWNNPPVTFMTLPETDQGNSFNSPSKIQKISDVISEGTYLVPISSPNKFLIS